jgi:hypothetical protein
MNAMMAYCPAPTPRKSAFPHTHRMHHECSVHRLYCRPPLKGQRIRGHHNWREVLVFAHACVACVCVNVYEGWGGVRVEVVVEVGAITSLSHVPATAPIAPEFSAATTLLIPHFVCTYVLVLLPLYTHTHTHTIFFSTDCFNALSSKLFRDGCLALAWHERPLLPRYLDGGQVHRSWVLCNIVDLGGVDDDVAKDAEATHLHRKQWTTGGKGWRVCVGNVKLNVRSCKVGGLGQKVKGRVQGEGIYSNPHPTIILTLTKEARGDSMRG